MKLKDLKIKVKVLSDRNPSWAINKLSHRSLKDASLTSSNSSNASEYLIYEDVKSINNLKKKAVNFSLGDEIMLVSVNDEDMDDLWYNQSDLCKFRNDVADDARYIPFNKSYPHKKLQKAYDAARNKDLKPASTTLKPWCSFTNQYTCLRGIENSFRSRTLEKLETDRKASIEKVMSLQYELIDSTSSKDEKAEHKILNITNHVNDTALTIVDALLAKHHDDTKHYKKEYLSPKPVTENIKQLKKNPCERLHLFLPLRISFLILI